MIKLFLKLIIISVVLFFVMALASYLVTKDGRYAFQLGYPLEFYHQFMLSGADTVNFGWTPMAAVIDYQILSAISIAAILFTSGRKKGIVKFFIVWILTSVVYYLASERITKSLYGEEDMFRRFDVVGLGLTLIFVFYLVLVFLHLRKKTA